MDAALYRPVGDTFCAIGDSQFGPISIRRFASLSRGAFSSRRDYGHHGGGKHLTGLVSDPSNSNEPNASPTPAPAAAPVAAPSWKGRMIKRFRLLDELGEGAMGRVFVAEDTVLKRHVAMKLCPRSTATAGRTIARSGSSPKPARRRRWSIPTSSPSTRSSSPETSTTSPWSWSRAGTSSGWCR